jgi:hypothetical protein
MLKKKNLEIEWRETLVKALQPSLKSLVKKHEKELEKKRMLREKLSVYNTEEEAKEAFGYGDITEEEYRQITDEFEIFDMTADMTAVSASLDELIHIISRLKSEIRYFEWEDLPEEEKTRREKIAEDYEKLREERKEGNKNEQD